MSLSTKPRVTNEVPRRTVDPDGTERWMLHGEFHREDGPAVEYSGGTREWWFDGRRHRDDGPAVEWRDGTREWYLHGQRHRDDGPAIEYADGRRRWFFHDTPYTKPAWLCELLKDRPFTTHQRKLLLALSENWEGTPDLLYETVTHLA